MDEIKEARLIELLAKAEPNPEEIVEKAALLKEKEAKE